MALINATTIGGLNCKDATATPHDILDGKKAGVGKEIITGNMPNNGNADNAIENGILKEGYTSGGIINNLTEENIKYGIVIGGKVGTCVGVSTFLTRTPLLESIECTNTNNPVPRTATMPNGVVEIFIGYKTNISAGLRIQRNLFNNTVQIYRGDGFNLFSPNNTVSLLPTHFFTYSNNILTITGNNNESGGKGGARSKQYIILDGYDEGRTKLDRVSIIVNFNTNEITVSGYYWYYSQYSSSGYYDLSVTSLSI